MNNYLKALPSNVQAEQELLSGIFYNPKVITDVVNRIIPDDFYRDSHKLIYNAMCGLFAEGKDINIINMIETIGKDNITNIGGISYISELIAGGTPGSLKQYMDIIKEKSFRRKAIKSMNEAMTKLYDETSKASVIVGKLANSLVAVENKKDVLNDEQLLSKTVDEISRRQQNGGEIPGMETGFKDFDKATNGLKGGELFILAGRPSMGKTLIALNMQDGLALNGHKSLVCELEMTEEMLGMRRLAYSSNISAQKLQTGKLDDKEFLKLMNTCNFMAKNDMVFTDCSDYQSILTVKAKAKAMKNSKGLDVLIIDHLGLMDIPGENRNNAIGEVTRQLKLLAKELDICVILLSQLSRAVEQRADKRPMMSDLRDSGNIEQDADLIVFAYRDEYYNPESTDKNIMEWIIAKQRNGRVGTLRFGYQAEYQKILNLDFNH